MSLELPSMCQPRQWREREKEKEKEISLVEELAGTGFELLTDLGRFDSNRVIRKG